ncbi:hypothetical protein OPV22_034701 [Ensete ventricosum]|uniref:Uncharacterized protein n=1 Tax=Ensete ventricosum TaxID=4639 RepID=A0AAV8Q3J7_ENSVE|nr:hypothetical protein OPV22_034701 [Ensete ventricosum]
MAQRQGMPHGKVEEKHDARRRKLQDLQKQIHDERDKFDFRLLQEQAGLVPIPNVPISVSFIHSSRRLLLLPARGEQIGAPRNRRG